MPKYKGYVVLTHRCTKEQNGFSAVCEELGTAVDGDTREEAIQALRDLVVLQLNTLERLRQRKAFFKRHGIRFYPGPPPRRAKTVSVAPGETVERTITPVAAAI